MSTSRLFLCLTFLIASLAVLACDTDDGDNGTLSEPLDEWLTCQTVADCVAIEVGCCDRCNGGAVFAVNSIFANEAQAAMQPTNCDGSCTEIGCTDEVALSCESGACAYTLRSECALLADCSQADHCRELMGTTCGGESVSGGCFAADIPCTAAETCVIDPTSGEEVTFPDGCVPLGWASCDGMCNTGACEGLGRVECTGAVGCMPLVGTDCDLGSTVYGACVPEAGCDDLPTCAIDPRTTRQVTFPDSCVPDGWQDCTDACMPP